MFDLIYNGVNQLEDPICRVEKAKHIAVGSVYLVPCIISTYWVNNYYGEQEIWMDEHDDPPKDYHRVKTCAPVYNLPHDDKPNGQHEEHYHADHRWEALDKSNVAIVYQVYRLTKNVDTRIEYVRLRCKTTSEWGVTPVDLISRSTLNHKCLVNGKCPHKGFDLSNTLPINGVITCPLHGLEFDQFTGALVNDPSRAKRNSYSFSRDRDSADQRDYY